MAGHPLRPATHRRLGRPLPHQLANGTRAHLQAVACKQRPPSPLEHHPRGSSGISPGFPGLSRSCRQITHALLTRSPLSRSPRQASGTASHDLHALGTPPAFVLSQDQTLRLISGIHRTVVVYHILAHVRSLEPLPQGRASLLPCPNTLLTRLCHCSVFKDRNPHLMLTPRTRSCTRVPRRKNHTNIGPRGCQAGEAASYLHKESF